MEILKPEHFFDLSGFSHSALFEKAHTVWQALVHLSKYIHAQHLGRIEAIVSDGAYLMHPETISIGEDSVIEPGAYILGPCIIGKRCHIRHGAYIRGNVVIGDNCVIGHTTELKNTIFLNNANAAHFSYVGDSIIGNGVNLGAGVKCANLRFDKAPIDVVVQGKKMQTNMKKLGAIVGDNCEVGCNAVLQPGTLFSKNIECFPGVCVGGFIEENSRISNPIKPQIQKK